MVPMGLQRISVLVQEMDVRSGQQQFQEIPMRAKRLRQQTRLAQDLNRHPRWLLWTIYHTLLVIPLWGLLIVELLEFLK